MFTKFRVTLAPEFLALTCRPLRDLAWSLLSSNLFRSIPRLPTEWFNYDYIDDTDTQHFLLWLQNIDENPLLLDTHLAEQRSTRLGIYYEQLLSFYFEYYEVNGERRFDLLAKNHQVNEAKRTLGEFDFIIYDRSTQCIKHVEVAVKFYLGHEDYNDTSLRPIKKNKPLHNWHNWVGPNFRDTLAIKMRHLQEHQLQLGKSAAGAQSLIDLMNNKGYKNSVDQDITCRLHISGRFFTPQATAIEPPSYCAQSNVRNFWLYRTDILKSLEKSDSTQYCLLPKQYWLSELILKDIEKAELQIFTKDTMLQFLAAEEFENEWHFAILDMHKLADQKNNKEQTLPIELGRFFIIN
jgi:hypothetical protein